MNIHLNIHLNIHCHFKWRWIYRTLVIQAIHEYSYEYSSGYDPQMGVEPRSPMVTSQGRLRIENVVLGCSILIRKGKKRHTFVSAQRLAVRSITGVDSVCSGLVCSGVFGLGSGMISDMEKLYYFSLTLSARRSLSISKSGGNYLWLFVII